MHRPTLLAYAAALTATLTALSFGAQAQTAPRYTARDLAKPTSAQSCGSPASLNDRGDALQTCTYKVGSFVSTGKVCMDYLPICYPVTYNNQVNKSMPAVWLAGSAVKPLDVTALSSSWNSVLLHSGEVISQGSAMTTKGASTGPFLAWRWLPPYAATGQVVAKPANLPSPDLELYNETQGGVLWWRSLDGQQNALQTPDGRMAVEPKVPDAPLADESVIEDQLLTVQDGDQTLHGRWVRRPAGSAISARYELWYRQGTQWQRIALASDGVRTEVTQISRTGRVLFGQSGNTYTWQAGQAAAPALVNGAGATVINGSGVMGGSMPNLSDPARVSKAVVWWQGQPVDLQGITTGLPSKSWVMRNVVAINERGQLLVSTDDMSKTSNARYKMVLLTPQ